MIYSDDNNINVTQYTIFNNIFIDYPLSFYDFHLIYAKIIVPLHP